MTTVYQVDQELEPGLRYTEEFSRTVRSFLVGDYLLWEKETGEYIGGLNVVLFRQRIGRVAVPSAGVGGVEIAPSYRRQGYALKLLTRAFASIGQHVPVIYLSDAISGLYERYGFVTCLAESCLELNVRDVERAAGSTTTPVQRFAKADLPPATLSAMIDLYNRTNARRSWTHERPPTWNQLHDTALWRPGSEALIVEQDGRLVGYAIQQEQLFGRTRAPFVVDELTALDVEAARALLAEIAARCWALRISAFQVQEPPDGAVGQAAKQLGCTVQQAYPPGGGWMGAIQDRYELLALLESELRRRAEGFDLGTDEAAAFEALRTGEAIPDDGALLRLLVGYWSLADASVSGVQVPVEFEHLFALWFPGGGTQELPLPHRHALDHY
jgi:GNAT superfamily N-acetyltransferase